MTLVSELELPIVRLHRPALRGDRFHEAMAEVREQGWLAQAPFGYMVLDREAGRVLPAHALGDLPGHEDRGDLRRDRGAALRADACATSCTSTARTTRACAASSIPSLSPRAVERYRPRMRGFLEGLLDDGRRVVAARAAGEDVRCDFVEAFAKPYPSQVIASVMGAPLEDAPRLHHWSNWIQKQFDAGSMASEKEQDRAGRRGVLRVRRRRCCGRAAADPGDDLMSMLIAAEEEGERLSRRGVHQPRLQHPRGRRRHDARARWRMRSGCSPNTRSSGGCWPSDPALAERGRRGGAALRADHAVHGAHPHRGGRLPRRDVPAGHGRDGLRVHRQPRPRRAGGRLRRRRGADDFRHHRRRGAARGRSRSAPACTTASARTSRGWRCRRASCSSRERLHEPGAGRRARVRDRLRDLRPGRAARRFTSARLGHARSARRAVRRARVSRCGARALRGSVPAGCCGGAHSGSRKQRNFERTAQ